MNSYLKLITDVAAANELVKLNDLKTQCQIDITETAFDAALTQALLAARHAIENQISRPIGEQLFELGLSYWPYDLRSEFCYSAWKIPLPRPPLIAVDTIKYTKQDDSVVTWYNGTASPVINPGLNIEASADPGEIFLKFATTWPSDVLAYGYPIKIRFRAGLTTIPEDLKNAVLICGATLFANREAVSDVQTYEIAKGLEWLYRPYVFEEMR